MALGLRAGLSDHNTVTIASQQLATTMVLGVQYMFTSTVACWINLGSNPTAVADTDGNHYIAAATPTPLCADGLATKVAVIRDSVDGKCCLSAMGG
jgi:hypothetical protein